MLVSGLPALFPERPACSAERPLFPLASAQPVAGHPPEKDGRHAVNIFIARRNAQLINSVFPGQTVTRHLGFECEDLVCQLLLLLFQQLVDLVRFDALTHQLEIGVVLLP